MSEEDDQWLGSLAGRTDTQAIAPDAEGTALRAALQAQSAAEHNAVPLVDPAREATLIARARAAGLLPPAVDPVHTRRGHRPAWLIAAALACVVVGVTLQMRTLSPAPVLRGGADTVIRISAADPLQLKQTLIHELDAVGVHATGYERLGREGLDADLPEPLPAAVRAVLARHGIAARPGTVLQVEIEPAPSP